MKQRFKAMLSFLGSSLLSLSNHTPFYTALFINSYDMKAFYSISVFIMATSAIPTGLSNGERGIINSRAPAVVTPIPRLFVDPPDILDIYSSVYVVFLRILGSTVPCWVS